MNIGDFVWSKLTGFPHWPSMIINPGPEAPECPLKDNKEKFYWVYFFGTHNYAWIDERHIKPYKQFKEKFLPLYRTSLFRAAVAELEEQISELEKDPSYKVITKEIFRAKEKGIKRKKSIRAVSKKKLKLSTEVINNISENDLDSSVHILQLTNITASKLTFGVLGLGIMGGSIVRNLIRSGHKVNIWNRSTDKCKKLEAELTNNLAGNLKIYPTPRFVLQHSDIVLNCVSDHKVSKRIIQNNFGINITTDDILNGKGLVEMTTIGHQISRDIRDMIETNGGMYLEAQIQGSKKEAEEGTLLILTAGNAKIFYECQSCFKAIGNTAVFLGEVGYASKINLILQIMKGVSLGGLSEGLALAERSGVGQEEFLNIFSLTGLASNYLKGKADIIVNRKFSNVEQSLKNLQKDMKLGLELSNEVVQPMPLTAIVHEIFKHCRKFDYGNQDASSIYMRTRH